ncbi:two component transcriptional regulator, LuxR family [Noviherbaspirillum humi]|uniref:Two component transcriptional regulator, LuxR family n=1 Tax=Noviherbaspirillum humi TaxID=1688639 RepID=A0A239JC36_9BURK|nr:response regulator transcription factor [Noviherbaspirillum humi]SNT03397.1 two component transcriptional regulator, LuxR family [Noviherbaspirillum humi]
MEPTVSPRRMHVLVVEDDPDVRDAFCAVLESDGNLQVLTADTKAKAIDLLSRNRFDVLLADLGLPDGSGLDVIKACVKAQPQCDIMVVTVSSDEENVLACIEAGAAGYVLKDAERLDIARFLRDLRAGGAPMSPVIARMVLDKVRGGKKPAAPSLPAIGALTRRESAILDLIARGDSYNEVARQLSVSVGTVQTHIKNIYSKLAVHSRGEAVFEAHKRGLLQMERMAR